LIELGPRLHKQVLLANLTNLTIWKFAQRSWSPSYRTFISCHGSLQKSTQFMPRGDLPSEHTLQQPCPLHESDQEKSPVVARRAQVLPLGQT
jgi:hypothetical protein